MLSRTSLHRTRRIFDRTYSDRWSLGCRHLFRPRPALSVCSWEAAPIVYPRRLFKLCEALTLTQLYPTCSELKIFPIASSEEALAVSITRTSSFQGSYSRLTTSSQVGNRKSLISAVLVSTRSRCSRRFEQITSISKIG